MLLRAAVWPAVFWVLLDWLRAVFVLVRHVVMDFFFLGSGLCRAAAVRGSDVVLPAVDCDRSYVTAVFPRL